MIASASAAMSSIVSRPSRLVLAPIPRLSNETSVNRLSSPSTCGVHPFPTTPTPWMSRTGGPVPARE